MTKRPDTYFYAKMLGGFSVSFDGRKLPIEANPQTKYMQLLLILIKAGAEGVERKRLAEIVSRDDGDRKKQMNNFRQHIHLLRQVIGRSHFPEGEYIVRKGSRYYFNLNYEVETDTGYLDRLLYQLRSGPDCGDRGKDILWKFCKAYTGEFLPMLSGEEWVIAESAYYQKWYFHCMKELCGMLKEEGNFEQMLELCTEASQIHPYDEWQAVQIDCLMAMNRYKEARKIYEDTAQILYKDFGISMADQVMARYQSRSEYSYYAAQTLSDVKHTLCCSEEIKGAYCCSYPSFQDMYRILARLEMKSLLMLCTMSERPGWRARLEKTAPVIRLEQAAERTVESAAERMLRQAEELTEGQASEKTPRQAARQTAEPETEQITKQGAECEDGNKKVSKLDTGAKWQLEQDEWSRFDPKMELLRQVIAGGIWESDVYTRYSANQFLILLIGADQSNGEAIAARLKQHWNEINRDRRLRVSFDIQNVEGPRIERDEDAEERKVYSICC